MLWPLFFLVYINDIIECSDTATFVFFADDTNIFEAIENANEILSCVSVYTLSNKLHINLEKTCYMYKNMLYGQEFYQDKMGQNYNTHNYEIQETIDLTELQ